MCRNFHSLNTNNLHSETNNGNAVLGLLSFNSTFSFNREGHTEVKEWS